MFTSDQCCTLVPSFEVQAEDLAASEAFEARGIEKTHQEAGCLHYAFSFNGNIAHCREGYRDAEVLLAHLENLAEPLDEALKLSKTIRLEVHAPATEIKKLKQPLSALNADFFLLAPGLFRTT